MIFRLGDHDGIHHRSRHHNVARINRTGLGQAFHLHDDFAAGVVGCQGQLVKLKTDRLFLDADVAKFIGGRAADDRHIDRIRLIPEILFAFQLDEFYYFGFGPLVETAAGFTRVNESLQPDMGYNTGFFAANRPEQMHHDALRDRVGFALFGVNHLDHVRLQVEVSGNDLRDKAFLAPTIQAPV